MGEHIEHPPGQILSIKGWSMYAARKMDSADETTTAHNWPCHNVFVVSTKLSGTEHFASNLLLLAPTAHGQGMLPITNCLMEERVVV